MDTKNAPAPKAASAQSSSKQAASPQAVPMLDVCRENTRLAEDLNAAMLQVTRSGAFVHGPACSRFEGEMAKYCGAAHAIG